MFVGRTLILLLVGLLYLVVTTEGIKCWFCNSMLDPFCSDPFDNSTANPKDCSLEEELPHLRGVPANMCRKIRMKVMGHWRYKRDCARLGEAGVGGDERYCIYRTGTFNIHTEYCTCNDKNGCNPAPVIRPSLPLVALLGLSGGGRVQVVATQLTGDWRSTAGTSMQMFPSCEVLLPVT